MAKRSLMLLATMAVGSLLLANPAEGQMWKKMKKKVGMGDKNAEETTDEGKKKAKKKPADQRCEDVSLEWVLEEDYSDLDSVNLTGVSSVPIEVGAFEDKRKIDDLREIGRNIEDADDEDSDDRKTLYVTTDDNVADFVARHTEVVLSELGYNIVGPGEGKVKITGELRSFHAEEDSTYKATTRLLLKATANGQVIYEGMHGEGETTFGRSYSCENYFVVLSESLMETVHSMAVQDSFHSALQKAAR